MKNQTGINPIFTANRENLFLGSKSRFNVLFLYSFLNKFRNIFFVFSLSLLLKNNANVAMTNKGVRYIRKGNCATKRGTDYCAINLAETITITK